MALKVNYYEQIRRNIRGVPEESAPLAPEAKPDAAVGVSQAGGADHGGQSGEKAPTRARGESQWGRVDMKELSDLAAKERGHAEFKKQKAHFDKE